MIPVPHCILWTEPQRLHDRGARLFEIVERFVDDDHLSRDLRRCTECGQLYFFEFQEEIDWDGGEDAMHMTYIPVATAEQVARLRAQPTAGLRQFLPALHDDWPTAQPRRVGWAGRQPAPSTGRDG